MARKSAKREVDEGLKRANVRPSAGKAATPDWDADLQVYVPYKSGLPNLRRYYRDLRARIPFAIEYSKSGIKASHAQTVFGQLWLVLNPLLLAVVYYVLISVISERGGIGLLAHIVGGLFVFFFISGCITAGAGSVTGGGRLVLNMAFPRLLMPMSAVRTAFYRFLPTLPVFLLINIIAGIKFSAVMLLGFVFLALMVVFGVGLAAMMATLQVYFRDTTSFLPYFMRIWLYLSPVLWFLDDIPERLHSWMLLNPLFSLIGGWTSLTQRSEIPPLEVWLAAVAWSLAALIFGTWVFLSKERDFAVRI